MTTSIGSNPVVSVVMPVWNPHPRFFRQAVESVRRQTFADWELVIVEDPSPRSASGAIEAFDDSRIRHIKNAQRSDLLDQLNQGLSEARAPLVARFDADDIMEPDRLQKQLDYLSANPQVDVLGSQIAVIDYEDRLVGQRTYPQAHASIMEAMKRFNPLAHPSVMYRKGVVLEAGGYQYREHEGAEDYELWCRLASRGARFANHPDALIRYRVHPGGRKRTHLRSALLGTLAVKARYWHGKMGVRARARVWGEWLLLCLPPQVVLTLFMRTQMGSLART